MSVTSRSAKSTQSGASVSSMEQEAEKALWLRFQAGDQDAFGAIYEMYVQVVYNYCRKFSTDELLIEDCIQGLFLDMWKNRESLSLPNSTRFYLYAAVKRRLCKEANKLKNLQLKGQEDLESVLQETSANIEDQLIYTQAKAEQKAGLKQGLRLLSDNQRRAILLKFYRNLSFQEISEVMHMSTDNIYKLVSRGILVLRKSVQYVHAA
ncbi:RNA polymerase sigma factor [Pontibacter sp. CAU 1760]